METRKRRGFKRQPFSAMLLTLTVILASSNAASIVQMPTLPASEHRCYFGEYSTTKGACICLANYMGKECEIPICRRDGTALRSYAPNGTSSVACLCSTNSYGPLLGGYYHGIFCESWVLSGKKCSAPGRYISFVDQCVCEHPFTGPNCDRQVASDRIYRTCNGNGIYIPDRDLCFCKYPHKGPNCDGVESVKRQEAVGSGKQSGVGHEHVGLIVGVVLCTIAAVTGALVVTVLMRRRRVEQQREAEALTSLRFADDNAPPPAYEETMKKLTVV